MARRKQPAVAVPATTIEAQALVAEYVATERDILEATLRYERSIDTLKAERDKLLATYNEANKGRFAGIKAWWEAGGKDLAGKARSGPIGAATIGIRLAPPAVKFRGGFSAKAALVWLRSLRWVRVKDFIRVKYELDKPAIIKAVQAEAAIKEKFAAQGLHVEQADEFFIDTGLDRDAIEKELAAS